MGYLVFKSSRSVKMRGFSFLSLYKSVFIFQFLNVKMYNYGKQNIIVNFIIKKLKKKTISSKSIKTKFSRRENLAFSVLRKVFIFQFLNNKMHNYVLFDTFVHFIIKKLKNKHTFLKTEKAKFSWRENLVFILFEEIVFFSI